MAESKKPHNKNEVDNFFLIIWLAFFVISLIQFAFKSKLLYSYFPENMVAYIHKTKILGNLLFTKSLLPQILFVICSIILAWVYPGKRKLVEKPSNYQVGLIVAIIANLAILYYVVTNSFSSFNIIALLFVVFLISGLAIPYFSFIVFRSFKFTSNAISTSDYDSLFKRVEQDKAIAVSDYSINWKTKHGYVNLENPFRHNYVVGSPGSGKTYSVIEPIMESLIHKNFSCFIYDYKYPNLATYAYNCYQHAINEGVYKGKSQPGFYTIYFKDVRYSHRLNPIPPKVLDSLAMARQASETVLSSINKNWADKGGEFFSDSAITICTSYLWYLRKKAVELDINICSLPHLVKFSAKSASRIITVLMDDTEIVTNAAPLKMALETGSFEQLTGQVATLQIALSKLNDKGIFWVMSDNSDRNISLDINKPENPNIIILGNDDKLKQMYSPALSLYAAMMAGMINQKGRQECAVIMDEFPTLYMPSVDTLLNTGRSNRISVTLGVQSLTQQEDTYKKAKSDNILNGCSNVFILEVSHEPTAKWASAFFGKELFTKQSYSINQNDVSVSVSEQYEEVLPPHKIMGLPMGAGVGKVAENPTLNSKNMFDSFFDSSKDRSKLFASYFEVEKNEGYNLKVPKFLKVDGCDNEEEELKIIDRMLTDNDDRINREMELLVNTEFWKTKIKKAMQHVANDEEFIDNSELIRQFYYHLEQKDKFLDYVFPYTIKAEDFYLSLTSMGAVSPYVAEKNSLQYIIAEISKEIKSYA